MFDPAVGFAFFEFEFGDGFDGVTGDRDFEIGGVEFVECAAVRVKVRLHSLSKRTLMAVRAFVRRVS